MPISRVRSVTLTSMMFMITMPPTTSEMQRDRHHHGRDHAEDLVDERAHGVRREGVEVVRLARAGVEPRAQRHARDVERLLERQPGSRPRRARTPRSTGPFRTDA